MTDLERIADCLRKQRDIFGDELVETPHPATVEAVCEAIEELCSQLRANQEDSYGSDL